MPASLSLFLHAAVLGATTIATGLSAFFLWKANKTAQETRKATQDDIDDLAYKVSELTGIVDKASDDIKGVTKKQTALANDLLGLPLFVDTLRDSIKRLDNQQIDILRELSSTISKDELDGLLKDLGVVRKRIHGTTLPLSPARPDEPELKINTRGQPQNPSTKTKATTLDTVLITVDPSK